MKLATHRRTAQKRAVKLIPKAYINQEDEEKLFSEVIILKSLDHPNIVRLFDLYEDKKYYYMVTEYCDGGELFDRIQKITIFSEAAAADFMRQLLSALVY